MQLTGEVHLRVPRAPGNFRLCASALVRDQQLLGHHATSILPHIGNLGWFLLLLSVYLHNFISWAEFLILQQHNKKLWIGRFRGMICSWSITSYYWKLQYKVLYNYHILQDLSLSLHLLIFCCCCLKNTLFTFIFFVDELPNAFTLYTLFFLIWFCATDIKAPRSNWHNNSEHDEPFGQILEIENNDKANGTQGYSTSLTIPLPLIGIILIKRHIEITVVFQVAENYCRNFLY